MKVELPKDPRRRLIALLGYQDMSQQKLAQITRISSGTISRFLNGWQSLNEQQKDRIARAFGVETAAIFGRDDEADAA